MYLRGMKEFLLLLLAMLALRLPAQDTLRLPLMGIDIRVLCQGYPHAGVLMYNMHDNENTSALAGRIISQKYGGEYFEILHTGKRFFSFAHGEDSVHIDPNRIYTDAGIWLQLEKNKITDTLIFDSIAMWRDSILSLLQIDQRELVVALHNNTDKNYSFKSYTPGEEFENEAEALYKGKYRDKDDFYFVTDPDILHTLAKGRYHIVMQNNALMTDDGSLSVYCGKAGIPYINVEAQHGHLARQVKMLIFVFQKLLQKE